MHTLSLKKKEKKWEERITNVSLANPYKQQDWLDSAQTNFVCIRSEIDKRRSEHAQCVWYKMSTGPNNFNLNWKKQKTNKQKNKTKTNKQKKKKKRRKTSFVSLTGGRNEWLAWNQIPTARPHSFGFKNTGIQYYQSAPDNTEIYSMNVSVVNYTVCKNTYFWEIVFETSAIWNQCFNGHKRWRHEWQW